jgi:hypothetical protein
MTSRTDFLYLFSDIITRTPDSFHDLFCATDKISSKLFKMLAASLLFLLAIGLSGTAALPNPSASGSSASTTGTSPLNYNLTQAIAHLYQFRHWPQYTQSARTSSTSQKNTPYNITTRKCDCEWIPGLGPITLKRQPVDPSTCPNITCTIGNIPVYHWNTDTCTRDADCPGTVRIAEKEPFYNATSGECSCDWLPGLGRRDNCADSVCITEKQPFYNTTSGECGCEWTPGLEPNLSPDTFCIAEQTPTFNSTSNACMCE